MGRGLDYTKAESLDAEGQELTDAENERLEELLRGKDAGGARRGAAGGRAAR
ncbi:hypothetical protein Skr01_31170 [Sphaerisporangium krabiense]|nr:hypothetical protein Skr01_31170 [Sphaerisporangium krabiense]